MPSPVLKKCQRFDRTMKNMLTYLMYDVENLVPDAKVDDPTDTFR